MRAKDEQSITSSIHSVGSKMRKMSMDNGYLTDNTTPSDGDFSERDVNDDLKVGDEHTGWSPSAGPRPKGTFDELLESFPGDLE